MLPDVTIPESLTFELTVTDNEGRRASAVSAVLVDPVAAALQFRTLATTVESDFPWDAVQVAIVNASGLTIVGGDPANYFVSLRRTTGIGTLTGTLTQRALAGIARFDDLIYTDPDTSLIVEAFVDEPPLSLLSNVITVEETNLQPTVSAGANMSVNAGDIVILTGSASDPDGSISQFSWIQLDGPPVLLSDQEAQAPTFTAPDVTEPSDLNFRLRVFDDMGKPNSDEVTISVQPIPTSIAFIGPPLPASLLRNSTWATITVEIRNSSGERITGGSPSTLSIQISPMGSGSLGGAPLTQAALDGTATFADLFYDTAETGVMLRAEALSTGLTILSSAVDVFWSSQLPGGFGSANSDFAHAMVLDGTTSPDILVGGSFNATDFQPAFDGSAMPAMSTNIDGFLSRYSAAGALKSTRYLRGPGNEEVRSIQIAGNGDIIAGIGFDSMTNLRDSTLDGMGSPIIVDTRGGADIGLTRLKSENGLPRMLWAASMGGTDTDLLNDMLVFGNTVYLVGQFTGAAIDLDPCTETDTATPGDTTHPNGFVVSVDLNVLDEDTCATQPASNWAHRLGSTDPARALALARDPLDGAIYVGGTFGGTVDFDPGTGVASRTAPPLVHHAFLLRSSSGGVFQWVRTFGGDMGESIINAITVDPDRNVWSVGSFQGDGFDPGFIGSVDTKGGMDIFVTSHLPTGDFRAPASFVLASGDNEQALDIASGPAAGDGVVIIGTFQGTLDVDPNLINTFEITAASTQMWAFAMQISSSSDLTWGGGWGAPDGNSTARSVALVGSGPSLHSVILSEVSGSTPADLDPFGPTISYTPNSGGADVVISKFSKMGSVIP